MNGAASARREWLVAALLALVWLGASAWLWPLMLPDEGRYVGVAWEMLRSRDWLTPTLDGLPFFHKPPLFYWVTAGAMQVFGLNEFATRAASVLAAAAAAGALYAFVSRRRDRRAANVVMIVLLAQPLWTLGRQFANLDMLAAACISGTILLFAHAALCEQRTLPYHRALTDAYALAALGVLAKGLIEALLPGLVIGLWLAPRNDSGARCGRCSGGRAECCSASSPRPGSWRCRCDTPNSSTTSSSFSISNAPPRVASTT